MCTLTGWSDRCSRVCVRAILSVARSAESRERNDDFEAGDEDELTVL